MGSFWTTYTLCTAHASACLDDNLDASTPIKVWFDDDVWVASDYESGTEWALHASDVPRLRAAS